jgi:hypothetical protein
MSDLLLRVRLEALQDNLRQVTSLVELIKQNGNSVRRLHHVLNREGAPIKTSLTRASIAADSLVKLLKNDEVAAALWAYEAELGPLRGLPDLLTKVEGELIAARKEVVRLRHHVEETDALLDRERIDDIFGDTARDLLMEVDELQEKLTNGRHGSSSQVATSEHWGTFRALVGNPSRLSVFQEYVDVAGGLSLRGNGMDAQFCAIADSLSEHWTRVMGLPSWFSIPARDEARLMTQIVIPLGFPEWTIWAVPLLAHEVGRFLVDKDTTLQKFTLEQAEELPADEGGQGGDAGKTKGRRGKAGASTPGKPERERLGARQARIRTYLADAIATYVMGPAYACACLLLKLDPSGARLPDQERGWDHVRARVVHETLTEVKPNVAAEMERIIGALEDSWRVAVEHFGGPEPADSDLTLVQSVINKAIATARRLERMRDEPISFNDHAWGRAKRFADKAFANLQEGDGAADDQAPRDQSPGEEWDDMTLTLVLNAAWYQRVTQPDPDATAEIARRVREEIWPSLKGGRAPIPQERMGVKGPMGSGL